MAVRCSKCGEELLGAVNRCWKCGQTFTVHAEYDDRPPVRLDSPSAGGEEALDAIVVEAGPGVTTASIPVASPIVSAPAIAPRPAKPPISTSDRIDAQRKGLMAMGGTVGSLVLGVFALALAAFRFEAALIATLGLVMGIWGLYSPRRRLALFAMLLCWLGIGIGTYTGVHQLWIHIRKGQPVQVQDKSSP